MEHSKCKEKKNSLWIKVILMNLVIFVLSQVMFQPSFETCDDNYMAAILYGTYGEYNAHFIFSNIILGKVLKSLTVICPILPWYAIVQYVGLFLAFTSITFVLMKKEKNQYRTFLCWALLVVFGYECYVKVQFTKTAGVLTIAGLLLIYQAIKATKVHIFQLILGSGLAILGSFWRFNGFFMILPIVGSISLFAGINEVKNGQRKKFIRYVICYGLLFVLCIVLNIVSDKVYNSNPAWKEYREFNKVRAEMLDYGFPEYDENREIYQKYGISKNDLEMYRNWNYGDPERFTEEMLRDLADAKEERHLSMDVVREFFTQFPVRYLKYPYFTVLIILLALWLLNTKRDKVTVGFAVTAFVLIEFYLFYKGRYFINRIDMPIVMALCVVLAMQIEKIRYEGLTKYVTAAVIGGVLLNGSSFLNEQALPKTEKEKQEAQEVFNLMNADKSHFYIMENYTSDDLWTTAYSVWDVPPVGVNTNCDVMGGWRYNTPLSNYNKECYGIKNPFRDIIDNPNVYMVNDYYMAAALNYIQEHYCETASAQMVKEINGHRFYKIVSKPTVLQTESAKKFDDDIEYKFTVVNNEKGEGVLEGYAYKKDTNSYYQQIYIGKYDSGSNEEFFYPMKGSKKSWKEEWNRKFSWGSIPLSDMKVYKKDDLSQYGWKVYLEIDGELYWQNLSME